MRQTKRLYTRWTQGRVILEAVRNTALALLLLQAPAVLAQADTSATVAVSITGVKDELLSNVRGFLPLYPFNKKTAPSAGRLRYLHGQADEKIRQALAPYGYYRPAVTPTLDLIDDVWKASYAIKTGDRIVIKTVDIEVTGEAKDDSEFTDATQNSSLKVGDPLLHENYESLKQSFQVLASQRGYFDAKLEKGAIRIDLKNYEASVILHFDSGIRYFLGEVSFNQDKPWLSEAMLGRFSDIEPGQAFLAGDLQQLQGDLSNTEYYEEVTLDVSPQNANADHEIPVVVNLSARNPTRYTFGAGYGTDTGARVKAGVTRRRINEAGHHFTGEVLLAEYKYGIAGDYVIPGSDPRTDSWGIRGSLEDEHSDNNNYTSASVGGYYRHRDGLWMKTYSLDYLVERFEVSGGEDTSKLLIPSAEWTRTFPAEMDKRIYPTYGTLIQFSVRGAGEGVLSDTSFIQPMVSGKWIYSFANSTRLIARGAAGTTSVTDFDKLPTSLRFFTGGDKSVRGYGYNDIGPTVGDDVVGGKNLLESSLEYEIPFTEKWSVAAFADIGDAFDDKPDYKRGVGLGLHWRSPIGPVRLDLGHALDRPPGKQFRLHLTIGSDL
ncbi:autotransporter assembly complex protein TamA [Granulosicoccus antarcticus]|uniref:Translocation and assembly module subunit TamA n=1 Tax=Granulosicoccus antarcticus IMCC3135 TaxID=1192854 RepID=A0A2Z2NTI7_9GAMM|nr:autotransporter assembly complex family protein [Granulosicoccus antarcticus]ASJ74806.1 Translocation and assembly module TamA [Granulosicoccus antarcticus IMCC3135]